jgi:hypothetical protein
MRKYILNTIHLHQFSRTGEHCMYILLNIQYIQSEKILLLSELPWVIIEQIITLQYCSRGKFVHSCPLKVKGKITRVKVATGKEAFTVHAVNIISQQLYFVAHSLNSMSVMSLECTVYAFAFLLPASLWRTRNAQSGPGYKSFIWSL